MIVLLGSTSGPKMRAWIGDRTNIGVLLSPLYWLNAWCQHWATDNDVFAHCDDPGWWCREGERNWLKMLDKVVAQPTRPMFCLLPDVLLPGVIGDWEATLERAYQYIDELWCRHLPVAVALQNGAETDWGQVLRLMPDYVFIGGSTTWKWGYAEEITEFYHAAGVRVHIGRVSGRLKMREALRLCADSCDGTGWMRHPSEEMPKLLFELDGIQPSLGL